MPRPPARSLAPFLLAGLLAACSSGPSAEDVAAQEKAQVGGALGMAVSSLETREARIRQVERRNLAGHAGVRERDLWGLRVWEAGLRGSRGELLPLTVLRLELGAEAGPGWLYLGFDHAGVLRRLGLDAERLDRDGDAVWPGFLAQFEGREAATAAELPTPNTAWQISRNVEEDPDGLVATLYEHRRLMAANAVRTAQVAALTGRGSLPSPAVLHDWSEDFARIGGLGERLEAVIGRDTARAYPRLAGEARTLLGQAAHAASSGQAGELRRLVLGELPRASCQACHQNESALLGGALRPALASRLTTLGAPPLFRVGEDVWAPEGRERTAQYLASMTKAGLLLAGVMRRDDRL